MSQIEALSPEEQNERCLNCFHERWWHWDGGKCADACHCDSFVPSGEQGNPMNTDAESLVFQRLMQAPDRFVAFNSIECIRAANQMVETGLVESKYIQHGTAKFILSPEDHTAPSKPRYVKGYRICIPGIER